MNRGPFVNHQRRVNRGQGVGLAVCKGGSLCDVVFLKGPGKLRPRAEGVGPSWLVFDEAKTKAHGPFSGWHVLCPLQAASAIL